MKTAAALKHPRGRFPNATEEQRIAQAHMAKAAPHLERALFHYQKAGAPRSLLVVLQTLTGHTTGEAGTR